MKCIYMYFPLLMTNHCICIMCERAPPTPEGKILARENRAGWTHIHTNRLLNTFTSSSQNFQSIDNKETRVILYIMMMQNNVMNAVINKKYCC